MTISDKNVEHSAAERGGGAAEKRGEHQENLCVTGHRGHQGIQFLSLYLLQRTYKILTHLPIKLYQNITECYVFFYFLMSACCHITLTNELTRYYFKFITKNENNFIV